MSGSGLAGFFIGRTFSGIAEYASGLSTSCGAGGGGSVRVDGVRPTMWSARLPCGVLAYAPLTPCLSQACFPPALNVSSLSDVSSGAHALLDESKLGCEVEALLRP